MENYFQERTWNAVLKKAGLEDDDFAKKIVEDLLSPRECHPGWLAEAVVALEENEGITKKEWEKENLKHTEHWGLP